MKKLGFIVCNTYAKELERAIADLELTNTVTKVVPFVCGSTVLPTSNEYTKALSRLQETCDEIITMPVATCTSCVLSCKDIELTNIVKPRICSEWVVPPQLLQHYIEQGRYVVTPGWLRQWRHIVIKKWGFNEDIAPGFFSDSASEILVMDTGIYPDCTENAEAFSRFAGLPYATIPIGLDYFKNHISSLYNQINNIQLANNNKELVKKLSEYSMIVELVKKLSCVDAEEEVNTYIFELLQMFFAPAKLAIILNDSGKPKTTFYSPEFDVSVFQARPFADSTELIADIKTGKGFYIRISFNDNDYGHIIVDDLLFPDVIPHYKDLAAVFAPLFGLLISNVRQIVEIRLAHTESEEKTRQYILLNKQYQEQNRNLQETNYELFELNEELKKREEMLSALNATKDMFFSIISHDLRSPFASLIGLSEVLRMKVGKGDLSSANLFAEQITSISHQSMTMVENLLKWAQIQTGRLSANIMETQSMQLIEEVYYLMSDVAAQKNITLRIASHRNHLVMADPDMVKTVLRNLVSNAIKYSFEGGEITIGSSSTSEELTMWVKDQGTGMSSNTVSTLFKIVQNKSLPGTNEEHGSGLGLILCKEFAEKNNGRIWAESSLGQGSCIFFTLKLSKKPDVSSS